MFELDRETKQLTAHLFQVDGVTEYVNWAISKGMGVMDVNVPSAVPHEDVREKLNHLLPS